MAKKIRVGDTVIVISGKEKGKIGIVKKMLNSKLIIHNINMVKKHLKGNVQKNTPGKIVSQESPMHISNIAIFNKIIFKSDKIKFIQIGNKKKRMFKSDHTIIN